MEITPFTVHEADIALFHAWHDGFPVGGPFTRHQELGHLARFHASLRLLELPGEDAAEPAFGEWRRAPGSRGGGWSIESTGQLSALADDGAEVSSLPQVGTPLIVLVRFYCRDTGRWRLFQFHDAEILPSEAGEDSERMAHTLRIFAGWREEWQGGSHHTLPPLVPRLRGVIEWRHLGRSIRCWEYDPAADAWEETAENQHVANGSPARYVSLTTQAPATHFHYLAALTEPTPAAGTQASRITWLDAAAFSVSSSGLTPSPGWSLETHGCAEPLTLPPSGRHWEHPRVVIRFLGRIYATVSHGVIALPSLTQGEPDYPPLDFPIRIGRLLLLPEGGHLLPQT